MATQKHMGRNKLIERLTAQVGDKGTAIGILKNRGHLTKDGKFTVEGMKRNAMTAEERAKDRASKKIGKPTSAFKYNPKTNMAKLKG
mgnify:CR=1 FL=1|jgi:hypothetical protein|tara:strand:+ start:376 stop:636 length:261 start_codon:yes stop_codon:yes gene_type:complete